MFNKINHWWTQLKCKWAKRTLEQYSPRGEHLAFINDDEAKILKRLGGAGQLIEPTGVKSYFWPILLRMMAPRLMTTGLMGTMLAGSTMSAGARLGAGALGGLGSLAGGVVSGLGSVAGGLLGAAGSMLSGSRGGGGGAVAPSFGAQPFAGGAPLSLSAPGASRALVPSGGGGELDAAMGGALTAQQSQQTTIISLLQQIAATVGVIAQNTAGLIGIQSAQLSGQQQAIEDQRTQLSLKGGETDDTTKETGPKPKWFANPLGKTGQKMLDFMKNPLPAAIGLFGIWWWLRNNMDVFEKVLVPILRFFKNLQEDPKGTWDSLKETVTTFAVDSFNKIGHSMGNSVLDIFGFQFKDDKSWDIISQPGGKWDTLNPFTGKVTFWTAIIDGYNLILTGRYPDGTRIFTSPWADWMYDEKGVGFAKDPAFEDSKDAGFWKTLLNLTQLKHPDGTPMMPFLKKDATWRKDFFTDQNKFIEEFKEDMYGLQSTDWFDKVDDFMKNDFRMFMENLVPSKETLDKLLMGPDGSTFSERVQDDIDFITKRFGEIGKFFYNKETGAVFGLDIQKMKDVLPTLQEIVDSIISSLPKWMRPDTVHEQIKDTQDDIRDVKGDIKEHEDFLAKKDFYTATGRSRVKLVKKLNAELLELEKIEKELKEQVFGYEVDPSSITGTSNRQNIQTFNEMGIKTEHLKEAVKANSGFNAYNNTAPIVIDGSTTSSLAQNINQISQAELSSQNEEYTARALLAYQGHIGFAKGLHGF